MYINLLDGLIKANQYKRNCYDQKEIITNQECICNKFYLIKNGVVKVSSITERGDEVILFVLSKGQVFGSNPIIDNSHINHSCESLNEETILYEFDIQHVRNYIKENHFKYRDILIALGNQYFQLERRIQTLTNNSAEHRLINALLEFMEKFESISDNNQSIIIDIPLNQEEISNYIRVTRVTINKIINKLKKDLLIESNQHKIILKKSFFDYQKGF
ncbi:Crp/Fnr family transcriptional regulator [uncultured Aquimarina sp.]|uniref:Crp/Fnr family transcriptional regulator n=1 Tax=uncultured Aquimarina sp. TaxID=575652 RepID=UPI0026122AF9|nr:Crp/Fnr family transcriptional regulator [uncultured Aquimarina sp.]